MTCRQGQVVRDVTVARQVDRSRSSWPHVAMTRIRVGALKDRLSETLRAVENGASVIVTDRNRPIACIIPIPDEETATIVPRARPFATVLRRRIAKTAARIDSLALLRAERGSR